jgi:hypothetical protein
MSRLQKEIGNGILVQSVVDIEKDKRMEFNEWMAYRVQSEHYANDSKMYLAFQKLENNGINKTSTD